MARRGWVWFVGVGLCGGLLSACAHTVADQLSAEPPAVFAPQPVAATPPRPASAPVPAAKEEKKPADPVIRPVKYPAEEHTAIDLLPPDRPAPEPRPPQPGPKPSDVKPAPAAAPPKDPPLVAALRCYLERNPAEALAHLRGGDPVRQELLLGLLPLVAELAEGGKASSRDTAAALDRLDTFVDPLRARAALVIDKLCFCSDIKMFGVYTPLPEEHSFVPGEYVHVYAELRNFSSLELRQTNGHADYEIVLASKAEIRDAAGKPVWRGEINRNGRNVSHTRRHDYFDGYHFCLPEADKMPSGLYTLWVYVTDGPTGRVARRSLDFHVSAVPPRGQ